MQKFCEVREIRNIFMKPYANHKNGCNLPSKQYFLMRVFIYHKIITKLKSSYCIYVELDMEKLKTIN